MKPEFYKKVLKNGLTVLFEKRQLPIVTTAAAVKWGSEYESAKLKGISHFIEHLVFKGTKNRTVKEISDEIEKKGGIVNAMTSEEFTAFWNEIPSKHFETGIDLASDLILNPLFEEEPLERERKVILEEIKMYHDDPRNYVLMKIKELLYKKPFGMFGAGTQETMNKITRKDILELFNSKYGTNKMMLAVVGKADFQDICGLAEKLFPKKKTSFSEKIPIKTKIIKEQISKRRDIDQAHLTFGFHMPRLVDKNRYAAEIFNAVLGVGMSSRLWQEIREKRGLAYAVKGELEQDKNYGYEVIYAGTVKEKIKEVKQIILKEIKKMGSLGKKDFDEAKEQLYGLNALASESSSGVIVDLIQEENAGGAEEAYKYDERIKAVKLNEVRELSKLKNYAFTALVPT